MKNVKRTLVAAAVLALLSSAAFAQSKSFALGKWTEIQNAILKELNHSYVDSLPIDRIEKAGIDAMLESLDPYTVYVPEEDNDDFQMMIAKAYGGIGAIIYKPDKEGNTIINEPYAGSPAAKAGLRCGDEILEIDGISTHGLDTKQCSDRMKGKPGTAVKFKVLKLRQKDTVDISVTRERIHLPDVEYCGMVDDTTGYILQSGFTENVSRDVKEAVLKLKEQGMKRLILDLRDNGGGLLSEAVNIVSLFVPRGSVVVTSKGGGREDVIRTSTEPVDTILPIMVLVDSGTASSSEIVSGALQDYDRAVILGKRTYGKGLVQGMRPLPYNGTLKVTTAKYYTPSGRCVQAIDYAHRNEDGSVGYIPDSLTKEFRTAGGRTVRDGGGITPDVELKSTKYSRITYALVAYGIIEQYTLKYVAEHQDISSADEFRLSDKDYDDFVSFASSKTFDSRSTATALFDQMRSELDEDGLSESMKAELDAVRKAMDIDKSQLLRLKKNEIVPLIEEEIVVRYYFQEAGVKVRLRYDAQLKEALGHSAVVTFKENE